MTKVNKEKLVNEICTKIYTNNKGIAIVHADDMEKCFEAVDLMRLAAFSAISILKCLLLIQTKNLSLNWQGCLMIRNKMS